MRNTYPNQRMRLCFSSVYILGIPALSKTLFFVICVLPGDVQDAADAAHVEYIELLFLSSPQGPGLAAVQESAEDVGSEDLDFLVCSVRLPLIHTLFVSLALAAL